MEDNKHVYVQVFLHFKKWYLPKDGATQNYNNEADQDAFGVRIDQVRRLLVKREALKTRQGIKAELTSLVPQIEGEALVLQWRELCTNRVLTIGSDNELQAAILEMTKAEKIFTFCLTVMEDSKDYLRPINAATQKGILF